MVHIDIRHIAFAKFMILVFGVAHWVGCIQYFLARVSNFDVRLASRFPCTAYVTAADLMSPFPHILFD